MTIRTLVTCLLVAAAGLSPAAGERPNILFVFLDDFGWKDAGFMGSDFYETPHLDRLAAGGMVFTNAYAGAANCAPSRACLLSGQYSPRHQVYNVGTGPRGKSAHRRLQHVAGTDVLAPEIRTWAHQLQGAGYRTATMGKWHLSGDPIPYGFDINVGGTHSGSPPKGYYPPHGKAPGLEDAPEDEYLTETLCDRATQFIEENRDGPWALYLTLFAVHTPIQANRALLPRFENKPAGELHDDVAMATMIASVDEGVGKIVATLERLGLKDDTAIVFTSDNGGYGPATDMAPLKGYKGTYYEGGIRVPFFVNWPGVVDPGQRNETPAINLDVYPTLCELAGAPLPAGQAADGTSLVPLLRGEPDAAVTDRALFWHFPAYLQSYNKITDEQRDPLFRSRPCSIIRRGDYKLHEYFEDGGIELYHLGDDIGESTNLAGSEPERTAELLAELRDWRKQTSAPVPADPNPEFDAEAEAAAIKKLRSR